jgi:hypothetical protein
MTMRKTLLASAMAAVVGFGGAALAQGTAQQVNPSPMPPGSRAGDAPGMNPGTQGSTASGTTAQGTTAPGTTAPGTTAPAGTAQNGTADRGRVGGTGAAAPSGQPDVDRGTAQTTPARPGTTAQGTTTPGTAAPPATTGATTPGTATTGGGRSDAAPRAGANSFTEGQARARIGDAGFNDVQELRLDEQGIWRGRAMREGRQTGVALDYQGNVVATTQ